MIWVGPGGYCHLPKMIVLSFGVLGSHQFGGIESVDKTIGEVVKTWLIECYIGGLGEYHKTLWEYQCKGITQGVFDVPDIIISPEVD